VLNINYELNPALPSNDYWRRAGILYPVYGFDVADSPLPMKAYVYGVTGPDGKTCKAYDSFTLQNEDVASFEDTIGGQKVLLNYDSTSRLLTATDAEGSPLLVETMIWMCWSGFHPDTEVWREDEARKAYGQMLPTPEAEKESPEEAPESSMQ
jgi:hypothetical protein